MNKLITEAAAFFQTEKGFARLLRGFIRTYRRLGRIGGTVKLVRMTKEEKEALSGFMGKDYSRQNSATISLTDFQIALDKTKFAGLQLKDLLQAYIGEILLTRSEEQELYRQRKEHFFLELQQAYPDELQQLILEHILNKGTGTRGLHQLYDTRPTLLKKRLNCVLSAVKMLPTTYERLPGFASRVTKDPHGLDLNTETGRLFVLALQIIRAHQDASYRLISTPSAEEITEILGEFKIIRDDLLNFVSCTGLLGLKEDGQLITMWQAALQDKAVINLPLRELVKIAAFIPAHQLKTVFIVENSGVFSELLDHLQDKAAPPLICTHGQFRLAALLLIDKLVQSGAVLYYSGDFDPEGLQMAERLLKRHPHHVKLWHYTVENYEACLSQVSLSQARLNKLKNIASSSLTAVKDSILSLQKAGYQEQLVPLLVADITAVLDKRIDNV
ncbi:MAG TPA: TIGR02679 family protein [Oscillospiraceae bacterium]|nr:TIGR02679 family protein [Oscillospiraceae bacterium]